MVTVKVAISFCNKPQGVDGIAVYALRTKTKMFRRRST